MNDTGATEDFCVEMFEFLIFIFFPAAEYGSVVCDGVPMADIPTELQDSRVFKLHLRSNGLTRFPDSKLEGTGL